MPRVNGWPSAAAAVATAGGAGGGGGGPNAEREREGKVVYISLTLHRARNGARKGCVSVSVSVNGGVWCGRIDWVACAYVQQQEKKGTRQPASQPGRTEEGRRSQAAMSTYSKRARAPHISARSLAQDDWGGRPQRASTQAKEWKQKNAVTRYAGARACVQPRSPGRGPEGDLRRANRTRASAVGCSPGGWRGLRKRTNLRNGRARTGLEARAKWFARRGAREVGSAGGVESSRRREMTSMDACRRSPSRCGRASHSLAPSTPGNEANGMFAE